MRYEKILIIFFLLIIGFFTTIEYVGSKSLHVWAGMEKRVIMIDSGHGGWDPGRTGKSGSDEKDINLEISNHLQSYLETSGAYVVVSRATDEALGGTKKQDMQERKKISEDSKADLFISIHQNAFPQASIKGAQVFYYNGSKKGEVLAEKIQSRLKTEVDPNNKRVSKPNTDYYILKKMEIPSVIVECGFLSNPTEEGLLNDDKYREKVAWAIYMGIVDYFEAIEE